MGENNSYLLCRCDLKQQLQIFNVSDDSLRKGLRGLRYHFSYFKGRQLPLAEILCAPFGTHEGGMDCRLQSARNLNPDGHIPSCCP